MNNGTLLGRMPRPDKEEMYKFILDKNARVFKAVSKVFWRNCGKHCCSFSNLLSFYV